MRPSELRRRQRRSWIGFISICVGCILFVVLASLLSNHLVTPRSEPEPDTGSETLRPAETPTHVVRTLGEGIVTAARHTRGTLEERRRLEVDGAVVYLEGGLRLADFVQPSPDGADRLLLVSYRPDLDDARHGVIAIDVFDRRDDAWEPVGETLREVEVGRRDGRAQALLDTSGVTLRKAGQGIVAVEIPDETRCDPGAVSDVRTRKSVYVALDGTPEVILAHPSAGRRGNVPGDRLELGLTWREYEDGDGRGELTVVRRYPRELLPERYDVPFVQRDAAFVLEDTPRELLAARERELTTDEALAEEDAVRDLRRFIDTLQRVGSLEGSLDYCVQMPHRIAVPATLDQQRWRDRLQERVFDVRLYLANVLAQRGKGRAALDVFGLDDPGLILNSTARRREIITELRGPRVATLRMFDGLSLERRPAYRAPADRRQQLYYPLHWVDSHRLVVPRMEASESLGTRVVFAVAQGIVAAAVRGSTRRASVPVGRLAPLVAASMHGSLRSVVGILDMAALGRSQARRVSVVARLVFDDIVEHRNLYRGQRFPTLDARSGRFEETTPWAELQHYSSVTSPYDLSPEGARLLVDQGITCEGGFVQLCTGAKVPACRSALPAPALDRNRVAVGDDPSTTVFYPVPHREIEPCYPTESPTRLSPSPAFVGWLDDDRFVVRDAETFVEVSVQLDGAVSAAPTSPVWPGPPPTTGGEPDGDARDADRNAAWPWLAEGAGPPERRFDILPDQHALWLYDREQERDYLLQWWAALPFGPIEGRWQATISPTGRYAAVWAEGEGLWLARLDDLPAPAPTGSERED